MERWQERAVGLLAAAGALLLVAGTWLHPAQADPADSVAAFTEYAAMSRGAWVTAHLVQLAGLGAMTTTLILLAAGAGRVWWARATAAWGAAGLAVAAALQAVDGVALKAVVDRWATSDPASRPPIFETALGVRAIEIGLDGLLSITMGTAVLVFAGAVVRWAVLAVPLGVGLWVGGVLLAIGGYTPAAMLATTLTGGLAIVWMLALAIRYGLLPRTRPVPA